MRIIILLLFALSLNAQNNDQRLAYQYYIDGDYEKAILLYEEINIHKKASPQRTLTE